MPMSKAGLIPKIADSIRSAETQEDKLAILSKYHNEQKTKHRQKLGMKKRFLA